MGGFPGPPFRALFGHTWLMAESEFEVLTRQIDALKIALDKTNPAEAFDDYNRLFGDLVELTRKRNLLDGPDS